MTYTTVAPSDEYRTLEWKGGGQGWVLHDLDGTETHFGGDGLWEKTVDRNQKETVGAYDGTPRLTDVSFPDGRDVSITYDGNGRIATVTELGVDPLTNRTWTYSWTGGSLDRIDRPDGSAWVFSYAAQATTRMTHQRLEPAGGGTARVVSGWEYDASDNLICAWRGTETCGDPAAIGRWQWDYVSATETDVTDPYGNTATYTFEREAATGKPRVTSIDGDCPTCGGSSPLTTIAYDDPDHPLLPFEITDAAGHKTQFDYHPIGQLAQRIDGFGSSEPRTTSWAYDPSFPSFPTVITQPSVIPTCLEDRVTTMGYLANGNLATRTISACEQEGDTAATAYTTTYDYTGTTGGQPTTINPPGDYPTTDETTFTYLASRGDLLVESRSDPDPLAVGGFVTTDFHYDDYNRRIGVTDPNGRTTETQYDELDRVEFVIQRHGDIGIDFDLGDPPNPLDLTTEHQYNAFGDLALTILPRDNAIAYGYDTFGRLETVDRLPGELLPPEERTKYTLDVYGRRKIEERQSFDGGVPVTQSSTESVYTSRCYLDKTIHNPGGSPLEVTEYDYDCDGNLTSVWDAAHPSPGLSSAEYRYDALHRLTRVEQRWGGAMPAAACEDGMGSCAITTYTYDDQDHLISVTDAESNVTLYQYNDRDLLVKEDSPVSGETFHAYDEHGELVTTLDARTITTTRVVDAANRVTHIDYGADDSLDVDYTYGTNSAAFELGRLVGITRGGQTLTYEYDQFGRMTRDGDLVMTHDGNGNVDTIQYPGGITATYTHDFADRQDSLTVDTLAAQPLLVAGNAAYAPSGPLQQLDFGNGLLETQTYTERYFPLDLEVATTGNLQAPFFHWRYSVDDMGNVTQIDREIFCSGDLMLSNQTVTNMQLFEACQGIEAGPSFQVADSGDVAFRAGTTITLKNGFSVATGGLFTAGIDPTLTGGVIETRSFGYQGYQYFLTSADGPWGDLIWAYDKIGNRGSETRDGKLDAYVYPSNGSGNLPQLSQVQPFGGGFRDYTYDAAGNLDLVEPDANEIDFDIANDHRLRQLDRLDIDVVDLEYDGRSYLSSVGQATGALARTEPLYDSTGQLHALRRYASDTAPEEPTYYFYLAGRPVAQLKIDTLGAETWAYLTTDHLGTPVLATDELGDVVWEGGFEPFGEDWQAQTANGALESGLFLRLPGQWDDGTWSDAASASSIYQNVHRWYEFGTGRYSRPDPLPMVRMSPSYYGYVNGRPLALVDPLGLRFFAANFTRALLDTISTCALRVRDETRSHASQHGYSNRYKHCYASCLIVRRCPGHKLTAVLAEIRKEFADVKGCLLGNEENDYTRRQASCDSALQFGDFLDDAVGREFGGLQDSCSSLESLSCDDLCFPFRDAPDPDAGPLGWIGPYVGAE